MRGLPAVLRPLPNMHPLASLERALRLARPRWAVREALRAMENRERLLYTEPHGRRGEVLEWPNRAAC